MAVLKIAAALWLVIVSAVLVWAAIRYTDRFFWKGAAYGALIAAASIMTGAAIGISLFWE